ncbi:MAG TPA: sulfatase-like hydrolase/transferase, partial [Anseongella sp.]|nr:sulfatase-like hydrolase/transferase [Anseongella sp.]
MQDAADCQVAQKPNIIIILADDLGWGDVGYHGSSIKTPHIDRLAREGIELNRFYTAAVCSPTRAGLLTGRYPDRYGLRTTVIPPWSDFGVDTSEVFLPEVLAEAGYKNRAALGKWHLGHASLIYHPLNRGFTHFYGHLNGAIDYFTHKREGELDWHNDFEPSYDKGYSTDLIADEAIRNIKSYHGESPFFLYIAFNAPHSPLQAKEEDLIKYGYDKSKPSFGADGKDPGKGRGNSKEQTYAAMVSNMDDNIGRILQTLRDLEIEDNTLVLFQSDNGAAPGGGSSSGELRGHKFTEWEGGVRVPAVIKWPKGFKGSKVSEQVMGFVDVMPTLLEIAGVKARPKNPFDGISMLPVLRGEVKYINRNLFLGSGAIVNKDWKLIEASGLNPKMKLEGDQLFRISADVSEKANLKASKPEEYNELKKAIAPFNSIKAPATVPPYGEGREGFVAPEEWNIARKKPNIIVILADDMGFSDIGSYGGEIQTPNLDRLAAGGVRYKQFYNAARCCPTRAALLTGLYPHQTGMGWMAAADLGTPAYQGNLNENCVTIAEVLKTAGYATYMTGKWHLTNERKIDGMVTDNWPKQRGFDHYFGIIPGGANYFTPVLYSDNKKYPAPENFYLTTAISDTSVKFIDQHFAAKSSEPMFMYVAYTAPHWPLHALQADIDKYRELYEAGWDEMRSARFERQKQLGLIPANIVMSPRDKAIPAWDSLSGEKKREMAMRMAIYAAQIDVLDQGVGKIVQKLKEKNQLDNTLIFFLSDNGACAEFISSGESKEVTGRENTFESYRIHWANVSSTPFREYKHYTHEGGIATPLIVHWPEGIDRTLNNSFISEYGHLTDIMATCLEVVNAKYPSNYKGQAIQPPEGKSLVPHF